MFNDECVMMNEAFLGHSTFMIPHSTLGPNWELISVDICGAQPEEILDDTFS